MLKLSIITVCVSLVICQQSDNGQYQRPQYAQSPQSRPQYQDQPPVNSRYNFNLDNSVTTDRPVTPHPPAQVHYVNIGPELAGDYKFGYDTGKGPAGQSFREEVRKPDGTVQGAYGYVDAAGKMRIVKYTAGKEGFKVDSDQEAPGQSGSSGGSEPRPQPRPQPRPPPAQYAPRPQPPPQRFEIPPQHQQISYNAPPRLPPHALAQLQAFNRPQSQSQPQPQPQQRAIYRPPPQQQSPPVYQSRPAQSGPARAPINYNPVSFNGRQEEEPTTWGPPVIPVALLNYNIGTRH